MNNRTTRTTEEIDDHPPPSPNRIYLIVVWLVAAVACQWITDSLTWQLGFWPALMVGYVIAGAAVYWAVYVRYQEFHTLYDEAIGKRKKDAKSASNTIGLMLLWVLVPLLPTQIPDAD